VIVRRPRHPARLVACAALILLARPAQAQNWPSFRGPEPSGVSTGTPPASWDIARSTNVAGKTDIPGLAHSSPIVWGDRVYVTTSVRIYQQRVSPAAGGFSASPIAAAGRIYLASEDGDVFVVRAGRKFELLSTNRMGQVVMATPAISGGLLIVRTQTQLVGVGQS
jgi:hypothetical protein